MLYNSDGLPVICVVYQKKCMFLNGIVGTFYQYLPYFQNKMKIGKICHMKIFKDYFFLKTQDLVFKKPFILHLEKGGRLIFVSIR